jgi:hypothetical protein
MNILIDFKCFQKTKSEYWVFVISVRSPGCPHTAWWLSLLNCREYSHFGLVLRYLCMSPFGLKLDKTVSHLTWRPACFHDAFPLLVFIIWNSVLSDVGPVFGGTVEGRYVTVEDILLKSARLRFLEAYEVSIVID